MIINTQEAVLTILTAADSTRNLGFTDVIGNKADVSNVTVGQASLVGLCRYIIDLVSSGGSTAIGDLTDTANTGAVDNTHTVMSYVKQLVTDELLLAADIGNASAGTLGSIYAILGNPATSLATQIAAISAITAVLPDAGALTSIAQELTLNTLIGVPTVSVSAMLTAIDTAVSNAQTDLGDASARTNLKSIVAMLGNPDEPTATMYGNIGDFAARTNLASLLATLGVPDTAGKPLYTCLVTDRLDHADYGLSGLHTHVTDIQAKTDLIGVLLNSGGAATLSAILGDFANVSLVSRLTTLTQYVDTEVASIKSETDQIGTISNSGGTATLGALLGDFANTTLVARLNTIDDFLDTEIAAIKAKTDLIGTLLNSGGTATLAAILGDAANEDLFTRISKIPKSDGTVTFNNTALASINAEVANVVATVNKLDKLIIADDRPAAAVYPASVANESILAFLMSKSATPAATSYDNTTDSLEAISDRISRQVEVSTPDGSSTTWTQAAHRLFTVSGVVKLRVFGVVTETLTGAATIEVGVAGSTNCLIAQLADASTLAANDIFAGSTTATAGTSAKLEELRVVSATDVDVLIGGADITNGAITFYCEWIPVTTGASVVAAVWD